MTDTTESLRAVLDDSDDLIEAVRKDEVYYLAWEEARRLLLAKHDALATALERLEAAERESKRLGDAYQLFTDNIAEALAPGGWLAGKSHEEIVIYAKHRALAREEKPHD